MKRVFLNKLVVVAFLVLAALTSCNKDDDDKVPLLQVIIYDDDRYDVFEYDHQNRISKILKYSRSGGSYHVEEDLLIYKGNDLVKIEHKGGLYGFTEYIKNENQIIVSLGDNDANKNLQTTIHLNSDGYPVGYEYTSVLIAHQYQDGNMTNYTETWTTTIQGETIIHTEYKYDNNKSVFYHCKTPKWFMFYFYGILASQNNVIEAYHYSPSAEQTDYKYEYKYEFNSAGFPTKRIDTIKHDNGSESTFDTFEFIYK